MGEIMNETDYYTQFDEEAERIAQEYEDDELNIYGFRHDECMFGDKCLMHGVHVASECFTAEMLEEQIASEQECKCHMCTECHALNTCPHCGKYICDDCGDGYNDVYCPDCFGICFPSSDDHLYDYRRSVCE